MSDTARERMALWPFEERDWDSPDVGLGATTWLFMYRTDSWLHRRTESLRWVDHALVRRQVTVDLEMPLRPRPDALDTHLIPIAILWKEPLDDFDLRDEGSNALPVLTRRENSWVAWSVLAAMGEIVAEESGFDTPLPLDVLEHMKAVAECDIESAEAALARLWKRRQKTSGALRRTLKNDEWFRATAETLTYNFLLLTPLKHEPGRRRVIKFSYVHDLPIERRPLWIQLGWAPVHYLPELPAIDESNSYHFTIYPPPGLRVSRVEVLDDESEDVLARSDPRGEIAHVYLGSVEPGTTAYADVTLRPSLPGLVRTGALFSLINAILLTLFLMLAEHVTTDAGTSLLLTLPSVVAIFLVRPGEHPLATHLIFGLRAVIALGGLLPFALATGLALGVSSEFKLLLMKELVALAWIVALAAGVACISALMAVRRAAQGPESQRNG